ncbi:MAG: 2-phosphosulfolactate phosphatase [Phycisphaerales bacterium]|nr:2-phosphosulfolactate phosphatase [Phycisphaerales bacterium]
MPAPDLAPPPEFAPVARPLSVHLHPRLVEPAALAGAVVLVIDNLRASVTIAAALRAGARAVRPTLTVEDALHAKAQADPSHPPPLLGGERGGTRIDGFDLDNSPLTYTPDRCRGRDVVFTTTNGTAALLHASHAARVLVASLANLSAVAAAVGADPRPVHILCAGTRDEVSLDDCLPAGALVDRLLVAGRALTQDDSSRLCLRAWREASATPDTLHAAMRDTRGGRNLLRLSLDADVAFCAVPDTLPIVPIFDHATGLITPLSPA